MHPESLLVTDLLDIARGCCRVSSRRRTGSSLAEANIHTCGFSSGVGKTYAASRAANPDAEDLAFLEKKVASDGLVKELPRALACMRLLIRCRALQSSQRLPIEPCCCCKVRHFWSTTSCNAYDDNL